MNFGKKIRELRKRKGLSQEQLADAAKISLRTVQRAEVGETIPNGDSLVKLSHALGVSLDDILDIAPHEDIGYLTLLNVSAFSCLLHPFLGIICPLVMWILKKDNVKGVNDTGRQLVTFQVFWSLSLYIVLFILNEGKFIILDIRLDHVIFSLLQGVEVLAASVITAIYLINLALISINAVRIRQGKDTKYWPSLSNIGNKP